MTTTPPSASAQKPAGSAPPEVDSRQVHDETEDVMCAMRTSFERHSAWRTFFFFSLVLAITSCGAFLMADYLWARGNWMTSAALWGLFVILFGYLAFGFCHGLVGFLVRRCGMPGGQMPMTGGNDTDGVEVYARHPRVAVVIPVYNEPIDRVFAGIRAVFESVRHEQQGDAFDFFILSDSTKSEQWIGEELAWLKLFRELGARDRMFYRHRPDNAGKKSGNISDFCRTWGDHYHYMVVLDADSIMSGETLVELLDRMQNNPQVALIQTSPLLVGGESLYGRIQQFSNRLYGPVFMEGLAFWQGCGGNFWGHNAIIRLKPFVAHCDLPSLPGKKPFGGHILSHDFVEAGLLRRAGWEVWLAHDLGGSYEEGPQGIVEAAQRDQRWCQGNLQHGLLIFARGLRGKTRIHLANGILGYAAAPLWLLFMVVAFLKVIEPGQAAPAGGAGAGELAIHSGGLAVLVMTLVLLFGPKLLCVIDLLFDRERAKQFGGRANAVTGVVLETGYSALIAPVMMLFHTRFVIANLFGKTVGWSAQQRGANDISWDAAIVSHGWHTLIGVGIGVVSAILAPALFWWLSPVLIGLWFSIPLSVWSSRSRYGLLAKRERLFLTPEEYRPVPEVVAALNVAPLLPERFDAFTAVVLDPFLNACHVSLLRRNRRRLLAGRQVYGGGSPSIDAAEWEKRLRSAAETMLVEGPQSLSAETMKDLLSDVESMLWLHRQAWLRSSDRMAPVWQKAIWEKAAAV